MAAVDHPSVRMLHDLYHSAVMGERPDEVMWGRLDWIAHVQAADVPGRHEPMSGTVDWSGVLSWLSQNGYRGRVGLEYAPSVGTMQSLEHVRAMVAAIDAATGQG